MKTLRNLTNRPLKIGLGRGKFLHLGPRQEGNVHPDALERPANQKMLEAGELEVIDDSDAGRSDAAGKAGPAESHGHRPKNIQRTGDR